MQAPEDVEEKEVDGQEETQVPLEARSPLVHVRQWVDEPAQVEQVESQAV